MDWGNRENCELNMHFSDDCVKQYYFLYNIYKTILKYCVMVAINILSNRTVSTLIINVSDQRIRMIFEGSRDTE